MRCYAVIDTNRCKKGADTLSDRRTGPFRHVLQGAYLTTHHPY